MPEENDPGEEVLQIHISKGRDLESPKQFVCQGCSKSLLFSYLIYE